MSRNGSGSYSLPAGNPVTTGTTISSTVHNNTLSDIATALSDSLAKDGQTTPTANLPMGGYAHTGVGDATARTQYAKVSQIQDGGYVTLSSVSGTNTITATCAPAITAYAAGQFFTFVSAGANTGDVTLNINSLGAKAVTKEGATALAAGDIASGAVVCVEYDGTRFQLVGGRSVQPLDATLTALAELNADAGLVEQTGADTFTKTPITAFAKTLLDDADAATARATLGTNDAANITTGNLAADRITNALNASGSAPIYACRAWVNFNGTGTVAIRASGNVSSITDNGTGDYTVNFTTAMPDANYATVGTAAALGVGVTGILFEQSITTAPTTEAVRVQTKQGAGAVDTTYLNVAIFR